MNLIINTDGAARGNPGPASYGYVIRISGGAIIHEEAKTIGIATNNEAEYTAVLKALEYVKYNYDSQGSHQIEVICDSQLIVNQLLGNFKVKNANLRVYFEKIKSLEYELGHVYYKNVPREENYIADRLANAALDSEII